MTPKFKKIFISAVAAALALGTVCAGGCAPGTDTAPTSENPSQTSAPSASGTETAMPGPRLASLGLSDGTAIDFAPDTEKYTVTVPAGNPLLPDLAAAAEDAAAAVTVYRPVRQDGVMSGFVYVEKDGAGRTYEVDFVPDAAAGFVLQYGDRYSFPQDALQGKQVTYRSSDSSVLSVSPGGVITAKKVSASPVTVEAMEGETCLASLDVTRVDPAATALFLLVGQSNAWGAYDSGDTSNSAQSDKPDPGVAWYVNANDGSIGALTDLSAGRTGFGPALAKRWYELTGEKSLLIHTGISGAPIETWLKGGDKYSGKGNGYDNTLKAYQYAMKTWGGDGSPYAFVRTGCFWCQGETGQVREWTGSGWKTSGDLKIQGSADYYDKFMKMHADFQADMHIDFFSVMLVRALKQTVSRESRELGLLTDLVPVRAAQYAIANTTDARLIIASRVCDVATKATDGDPAAEGHGYMGPENVHRTQKGYNAEGRELAENTARLLCGGPTAPASLEVLACDGRTRLDDGGTVEVMQGCSYQLAATVLPLYAARPELSYSVTAGGTICSVDKFGKVTFADGIRVGDTAEVTVEAACGLKKTVKLTVTEYREPEPDPVTGQELNLVWNFDDLTEENGYSDLTLSSRSGKGAYEFSGGTIKLTSRNTDFVLSQPFRLTQAFDWSIEWRASAKNSSALFGTEYSKNDFIYVAFMTDSWSCPFRMVDSVGTTAMIPYGAYKAKNQEMNVWRVEYSAATHTMTLYYKGPDGALSEVVGTYTWTGDFTFNITHMFGRYASSSTLVDWNGEVDYIRVHARTPE